MAVLIAVLIVVKLQPVTKHLALQSDKKALLHLLHTLAKRNYRIGFLTTALQSIGGFMMMPFGTAFAINNLKLTNEQLPMLFMVSGVSSLFIMPMVGKIADKIDKFRLFLVASLWMIVVVIVYTNLSVTPLWFVMVMNILMMMGIMSRMIPSGALITGIPDMQDRGAFMSINSSLQQIAGGIAAAFAGMIVVQKDKSSPLQHYDTLGYIMVAIAIVSVIMVYRVSAMIKKKLAEQTL
jgi:predicted MFS family arabinose efflux permease